ncbi:MAG: glycosyltransferase [Pseudomonadota bacterium]
MGPRLSVIVCTYNPDRALLARVLGAIGAQTAPRADFELLIVDNNSSEPLTTAWLEKVSGGPVSLLRETRQGLTYARACGLAEAQAPLICFVDDDNELAADYLTSALEIEGAEPKLGVFGGVAEGALARPVGRLKTAFLPHLGVRDMGPEPLTGAGDRWGPWEPIGAGICMRREVGEGYVRFVENHDIAGGLGRQGAALLSGEDSLISRIAHFQGYHCGYRPQLRLRHHIAADRLTFRYMSRVLEGHGRSHVLLDRILGASPAPLREGRAWTQVVRNFFHRLRTEGPRTALGMFFWDRGYFAERNREAGRALAAPLSEIVSPAVAGREQGPAARSESAALE